MENIQKIIDVILYEGEIEQLNFRLKNLNKFVDTFIILENNYDITYNFLSCFVDIL